MLLFADRFQLILQIRIFPELQICIKRPWNGHTWCQKAYINPTTTVLAQSPVATWSPIKLNECRGAGTCPGCVLPPQSHAPGTGLMGTIWLAPVALAAGTAVAPATAAPSATSHPSCAKISPPKPPEQMQNTSPVSTTGLIHTSICFPLISTGSRPDFVKMLKTIYL